MQFRSRVLGQNCGKLWVYPKMAVYCTPLRTLGILLQVCCLAAFLVSFTQTSRAEPALDVPAQYELAPALVPDAAHIIQPQKLLPPDAAIIQKNLAEIAEHVRELAGESLRTLNINFNEYRGALAYMGIQNGYRIDVNYDSSAFGAGSIGLDIYDRLSYLPLYRVDRIAGSVQVGVNGYKIARSVFLKDLKQAGAQNIEEAIAKVTERCANIPINNKWTNAADRVACALELALIKSSSFEQFLALVEPTFVQITREVRRLSPANTYLPEWLGEIFTDRIVSIDYKICQKSRTVGWLSVCVDNQKRLYVKISGGLGPVGNVGLIMNMTETAMNLKIDFGVPIAVQEVLTGGAENTIRRIRDEFLREVQGMNYTGKRQVAKFIIGMLEGIDAIIANSQLSDTEIFHPAAALP